MQTVAKGQRVNLLDNPGPEVKDAVARGVLPTIYVSTVPAELIQTRGRPDYEPIEGTDLLHVRNSSANIVLDPADQRHYVLLSGRWFRSASLAEGPWEFVPHDKLPAAFAKIPEGHPRGAVLASVPGTPQAKEALIDNSIPQTAEVNRATTTLPGDVRGGAEVPAHRGHVAPLRGELARPGHPGRREDVLLAEGRGLVHGERARWGRGPSPRRCRP